MSEWKPGDTDFWNDPLRWDGISDPMTEMFWMKRRRDVIDVGTKSEQNVSQNVLAVQYQNSSQLSGLYQQSALQQAHQSGTLMPYSPSNPFGLRGIF